ncbi:MULTISPECIES: chloride channel protein [Streptomyces]|uniref:Chloride channel protein n=2 Tax=Streptomyces TaxID=1883 RepID=A0ABZ1TPB4_STRVG|nr:chloride channel protein [Streptomyces virginiae]
MPAARGQAARFRTGGGRRAGVAGRLVPVVLTAVGAAVACAIAQRVPHAAGSGIQHVEAVWRQEAEARTAWLLPAKFIGGLIAIGSGLVLGREGPIVRMAAAIGSTAGRRGGRRPRRR